MYPHIRLDNFLNRFFISRVSTRILTDNYIVMRKNETGYTGVVRREFCPYEIVESLTETFVRLTRSVYGVAPEVEIRGNLSCTLDYIPQHVSFMVQELLKNALRATVERHCSETVRNGSGKSRTIPPVVVELQKGDFHIIIKISDQGGGMTKKMQQQAWQYGWTSVRQETSISSLPQESRIPFDSPPTTELGGRQLAGFGFGLPLTRLHAQYFGGDFFMQALPGHGTDMYLLLNHLKEGSPSTETEDPSTALTVDENDSLESP